jgi:hypothetical protein
MKEKTEIEKQLDNLWHGLNFPYPEEIGMSKIIGDILRLFTQTGSGREYSITKKLKDKFNEYGVNIPNSITHQQLKSFTKKVPFQTMTEHTNEIKGMREFLFNNLDTMKNMDYETRLEYLKNYFKNEVKMFHKLKVEEAHLETRKGMTWDMMINELVDPNSISIKL